MLVSEVAVMALEQLGHALGHTLGLTGGLTFGDELLWVVSDRLVAGVDADTIVLVRMEDESTLGDESVPTLVGDPSLADEDDSGGEGDATSLDVAVAELGEEGDHGLTDEAVGLIAQQDQREVLKNGSMGRRMLGPCEVRRHVPCRGQGTKRGDEDR